ncbi:unnamed protein product [Arctia plantaginis]|uniref:Peptidase S1 domain-containing protein n=1 Tax=Arctia plantaginis TaxID=874455 RepID=A0A8S1AIE6_ARCPL|nr:unnamed protein product [Arctia plantaginis]
MLFVSLALIALATVSGQQEGESCTDVITKAVGRCKPLIQCEIGKIDYITLGKKPTFCSYRVHGQPVICCREEFITTAENPSHNEQIPVGTNGEKVTRRLSERKCEEYSSFAPKEVPIALLPDPAPTPITCDYDFISIGGDNARPGQYPHMAAIGWLDSNNKYVFSCGGSLISPRFVLTSGQCSSKRGSKDHAPAIVRLGDQNLDDKVDDGASPIDVPIRHIHKHPEFLPPKAYNNIALLELATDVAFNNYIRPACLWTKPNFPGYNNAVNSGWGESYSANKEMTKQLKRVVLLLLENDICQSMLPVPATYQILMNTQVCAAKLGAQDFCQGEPGSPLQVTSKDSPCIFHIIGITSLGRTCEDNKRPSVYTRVSSYLDWIEKIVWPNE